MMLTWSCVPTWSCRALVLLSTLPLAGCSGGGAPSFSMFGAFFPAWLLCGVIGIFAAGIARAAFVSTGLASRLPYQLFVCAAIGVISAVLVWRIFFGS